MKKKFFLLILIGAIGQLLMAGDWRTRYGRDAFGDEDPSRVVYTVNLSGTTNIVRPNENCILGVMAYPYNGYAVIKVFYIEIVEIFPLSFLIVRLISNYLTGANSLYLVRLMIMETCG